MHIVGGETRESDHFKDPVMYRKIILKWSLKRGWDSMQWIYLAEIGINGELL
jgi:hypothetical protein